MNTHLHIVCFTVPYPVTYGGVFDLYYKIKALASAGVRIHLHCYTTGRKERHLEELCQHVYYYNRKTGLPGLSNRMPYIVSSRQSAQLVERLNGDDYPVLAEGVHSTSFLFDNSFIRKKVALRLHNVEHIYYDALYRSAVSSLRSFYYRFEARLLKEYERTLARKVDMIFAVSQTDRQYYAQLSKTTQTEFLPVFNGFPFTVQQGRGCYCLYHGYLSINENESAVEWLLENVFSKCNIPLIVAGKDPSRHLKNLVKRVGNSNIVADPTDQMLADLLSKAQCHVLPSLNATGVKLKLIHALHSGRHCIVNRAAVSGSGLEDLCNIADNADEFRGAVQKLYLEPFSPEEIEKRKTQLSRLFDTDTQTQQLIQWLS